jgi:CheY-like chemotaxis protein
MENADMSYLYNRRILVVEDEALIAMLVRDLLADVGCRSTIALNVRDALALAIGERFDCGFLDVRIHDETVFEVADALTRRNVPLVFTSGHSADILPDGFRGHTLLPKPYLPRDLLGVILTELKSHSAASSEYTRADGTGGIHANSN